MLVAARNSKLEESIKLHQYIRDADDVISWLEEKQSLAASDDYGKDYEHLLVSLDPLILIVYIVVSCNNFKNLSITILSCRFFKRNSMSLNVMLMLAMIVTLQLIN